jgi:transcriptional regulator with XRE-family HTH domain
MIQTEEDATTKLSPDDVRQQFIDNRDDKSYRHAYADESLNLSIATQIKVLREQRELRQKDLAELAGMKQSVISRYENVNYSCWSINTLKRLAEAFDVVLDVRFRSFRDLVTLTQGFSRESLQVLEFSKDPYFSEGFASRQVPVVYAQPTQAVTTINLETVPDILYKQCSIVDSPDVGIDFLGISEGGTAIIGVAKNPIYLQGGVYAEDLKASSQYHSVFIGGSNKERVQRAST